MKFINGNITGPGGHLTTSRLFGRQYIASAGHQLFPIPGLI